MIDDDPAVLTLRARMKDKLLDALYRMERLEEFYGTAANRLEAARGDRLPPLETDAEQNDAMRLLEQRLTCIERKVGE